MKNKNLIVSILCLILLASCASVKQGDSWKSDNFSNVISKKILVASKSKNSEVSQAYEKEIVERLRGRGVDAMTRYQKYPELNDSKELSTEEVGQLIKRFEKDGIQGIVVTRLKDVKTKKKWINEGGYTPGFNDKRGKYLFSFQDYYSEDLASVPALPAKDIPETTKVLSSSTYFLEAVIYDLSLPDEEKIISIIQADVTDPDYASDVRNGFSKLIAKQFKK